MCMGTVIRNTQFYPVPDIESAPILEIPEHVEVSIISTNDVWCKVIYVIYTGYIKRKDLSISSEKSSNIVISIPKEHAVSLYEALKFVLKK